MRFWDASALVPLMIAEASSQEARVALAADDRIVTWWGTAVECVSAIARSEREGRMVAPELATAFRNLDELRSVWVEIEPGTRLRLTAERLTRVHPLRAGDALQLAAATAAAGGSPQALPFVTLDDRLAAAADREGFPVLRFDLT